MTDKITCPQCKTENNFSSINCVNCGFNFQINSVDSGSEPDWLALLRDSNDEDQSTESNLPDTN
jgi:transposase-like protein